MKTTSGIFLISRDLKVLIGHPTNHPIDFWSIPKGEFEHPENPFSAALRELNEETNIMILPPVKYHEMVPRIYKSGKKTLYSFCILEKENKIDFSRFNIKCNSYFMYHGKEFPEFDKIEWIEIEKAINLIHESQKDQLMNIYSSYLS